MKKKDSIFKSQYQNKDIITKRSRDMAGLHFALFDHEFGRTALLPEVKSHKKGLLVDK